MTGSEVRMARAGRAITLAETASRLSLNLARRIDRTTILHWENGDLPVPEELRDNHFNEPVTS